jgi:hypothetical protein
MATGFPKTYDVGAGATDHNRVKRPQVFDPALKHYSRAFRHGDPLFERPGEGRAWQRARRLAIDHVLRAVAESPWRDHLVLRGSVVLKAWLGGAAREPGDLDWVVVPKEMSLVGPWAAGLFVGLPGHLGRWTAGGTIPGGVEILTSEAATDEIWTYDRAPGRRIVFPWRAPGLPAGAVQLDFVFGEEMASPPVETAIPTADGAPVTLRTASREQSLAWKLLWLQSDMHPQGKDLYDAALLAEQTWLPLSLLKRTMAAAGYAETAWASADLPLKWHVDWENFRLEYPWVEGGAAAWQARLARALEPTFAVEG